MRGWGTWLAIDNIEISDQQEIIWVTYVQDAEADAKQITETKHLAVAVYVMNQRLPSCEALPSQYLVMQRGWLLAAWRPR